VALLFSNVVIRGENRYHVIVCKSNTVGPREVDGKMELGGKVANLVWEAEGQDFAAQS